jgi:Na+/H+-dicarboxylate symporter
MVLIPLVLSLLVTGIVATVDTGATGRLGATALGVFLVLLAGTAVVSALVATPLVSRIPIDPETTALMRSTMDSSVVATARQLPKFSDLIVSTVPANPIRAAADGAMLPLVTFAILFGLALAKIGVERRDAVARVFRAIADAMTVIVGWLIAVAPFGVFALAMTLVIRTGLGAVRALALYIALISGVIILITLLLYVVAVVAGRQPLARFARALVPPQAIAFSARSSLAALPAMVESARERLGFPAPVTSFVLPLAVTTLRLSTPIMWSVSIPFLARLYGVVISPRAIRAASRYEHSHELQRSRSAEREHLSHGTIPRGAGNTNRGNRLAHCGGLDSRSVQGSVERHGAYGVDGGGCCENGRSGAGEALAALEKR